MAKAAFMKHKDPADAALFYIILGKKSTLMALYKANKDSRLATFLANDFTTPKWKTAACQNAFKLQGQHRFF